MVEPVSVPAVRWMDKQWVRDALMLHAADRHVHHDACFGNIGWQLVKRANGLHEIRPHAHCSAAQSEYAHGEGTWEVVSLFAQTQIYASITLSNL